MHFLLSLHTFLHKLQGEGIELMASGPEKSRLKCPTCQGELFKLKEGGAVEGVWGGEAGGYSKLMCASTGAAACAVQLTLRQVSLSFAREHPPSRYKHTRHTHTRARACAHVQACARTHTRIRTADKCLACGVDWHADCTCEQYQKVGVAPTFVCLHSGRGAFWR